MLRRVYSFTPINRLAMEERYVDLLIMAGLFVLATIVLYSAVGLANIGRDSGVFLYIGQRILAGDIPYLDVWDHKGPAIYYINALGLWISRGSPSGVAVLEYISLLVAVYLCYYFLKQAFGRIPAVFASVLFLAGLVLLLGTGNWVEEYILPIQFAALYSFWKWETGSRNGFYPTVVGATAALGLLLRPNLIGIQLSIGLFVLLSMFSQRVRRRRLTQVVFFAGGALSVLLPVFFYFGIKGALNDFWDAAVRYNLVYSSGPFISKLSVPFHGIVDLHRSSIVPFALLGWAAVGYYLLRGGVSGASASLYKVALIALPIEFILVSLSGRSYDHYFLIWLPILTLLSAIFASLFLENFPTRILKAQPEQRRLAPVALVTLLVLTSLIPARAAAWGLWAALHEEPANSDIVDYVQKHTLQGSYLLLWGAETEYNFLSGRPSPTRYVYQYPLFMPGYVNDAMVGEFLSDIAEKKPLIIDASARSRRVPPLVGDERQKWPNQEGIAQAAPILNYIDEHYEQITTIGDQSWPVLVYRSR